MPPRPPFFSICIPQHNRTSFLIEVCRSLDAQTFRNVAKAQQPMVVNIRTESKAGISLAFCIIGMRCEPSPAQAAH